MRHPDVFSSWLSDDMAHALAAMSPPLETADVVQAADKLTTRTRATYVIDYLLRRGADLMQVRRVVEALRTLRDAGEEVGLRDLRMPRRHRGRS